MKNREIKFRAWEHDTKKMCRGYETYIAYANQNNYQLMQFTGLHDKNGKEIYEGDIVICSYFKMSVGHNLGVTEVDAELKGLIMFNNLSLCLTNIIGEKWSHYTGYENLEGSCEITYLHDVYEGSTDAEMSIEVIGNVFENPEILSDK